VRCDPGYTSWSPSRSRPSGREKGYLFEADFLRFAAVFLPPFAAEVFLVELLFAALLFAPDLERLRVEVVLAAAALVAPVLRVAFFKSPSMKVRPSSSRNPRRVTHVPSRARHTPSDFKLTHSSDFHNLYHINFATNDDDAA
jgi:hypothetical protein